jgi:hypothetical protein
MCYVTYSWRGTPAGWVLLLPLLLGGDGGPAADASPAQSLTLPAGAETRWRVEGPEEISTYAAFPVADVAAQLPAGLRFVTLADIGAEWRIVREHLQTHPEHRDYGISFIAVLRHRRFSIDDRELTLRGDSALAQWWAYVTTADRGVADTTMSSVLTLGFWIPDQPYTAYMRSKGHHAEPGDIRLSRDATGVWRGSVSAPGLRVEGQCRAADTAQPLEGGTLTLCTPRATIDRVVRVGFTPYRERVCDRPAPWTMTGEHPLARAVPIGTTSFLSHFDMLGGVVRP